MNYLAKKLTSLNALFIIIALLISINTIAQVEEYEEEGEEEGVENIDCPEIEFLSIPIFLEDMVLFEWLDAGDVEYSVSITYLIPEDSDNNIENEVIVGDGSGFVSYEWMPEDGIEHFIISISYNCSDGSTIDYSQEIIKETEIIVTVEHVINPIYNPGVGNQFGAVNFTSCYNYHCNSKVDEFDFYTTYGSRTTVEQYNNSNNPLCNWMGTAISQPGGATVASVLNAFRNNSSSVRRVRPGNYEGIIPGCETPPSKRLIAPNSIYGSISPNPVKNFTSIAYTTLSDNKVSMSVYNSEGKIVKQIFNQKEHVKGDYNETFDASDLATGVYYLEIKEAAVSKDLIRFVKF